MCSWLAPVERQALSCTCRALFAFINTNAPFRNLSLRGGSISSLLSLRRHARVLASATKVRWSSGSIWRPTPTKPWTVVGQSFRFMLSVLQTSTPLHTLQLLDVELKPSHQLSILSIPTLKRLKLRRSYFVPTTIKMPVSSIKSLSLRSAHQPAAIEYILGLLRSTLETLEVKNVASNISLILETVQLLRLTCFKRWGVNPGLTELTPRASSTITKLCITTCSDPHPLCLSDGVFPKLRELFSPWWIGVQLVPGRPVQIFYDTGLKELSDFQADLVPLAQSTRGIKALRLSTSLSMHCLLQHLATHVPQLQRLHVWTNTESLMAISQQPPTERILSALIEIHITFADSWHHIEWCEARPSTCCSLSEMCLWICPALELATISITESLPGVRAKWDIPPQQNFKLRRMRTGEWEDLI